MPEHNATIQREQLNFNVNLDSYTDDMDHSKNQHVIEETFEIFHIKVEPNGYVIGPLYTRYEFKVPEERAVKRICRYDDELRMRLVSKFPIGIVAPIPGKTTIGV